MNLHGMNRCISFCIVSFSETRSGRTNTNVMCEKTFGKIHKRLIALLFIAINSLYRAGISAIGGQKFVLGNPQRDL
jgi:hypothetical protein